MSGLSSGTACTGLAGNAGPTPKMQLSPDRGWACPSWGHLRDGRASLLGAEGEHLGSRVHENWEGKGQGGRMSGATACSQSCVAAVCPSASQASPL